MPTTRLEIEYDGSGFRGWAAQPGLRTVQGELETALATILGEPVSLRVAGRTDAGVHAWCQVASFESDAEPPRNLVRRLFGVLPRDVAVTAATAVADGFDARRDARSRTYCYRVLARPVPDPFEQLRSLWVPQPLDRDALEGCAEALLGGHDFTAFTPTDTDHVHFQREIFRAEWLWGDHPPGAEGGQQPAHRSPEAHWRGASDDNDLGRAPSEPSTQAEGGVVCFWIEADAFMHNMVRALVGTMLEVASGKRSADAFVALLNGGRREQAGETVAAHGLYLASVRYS